MNNTPCRDGKVKTVIVKNMSRMAVTISKSATTRRASLQRKMYGILPSMTVWTVQQERMTLPLFRNLFNDFYARDTSKKIRAVMKAKGNSGEHLCTNPLYGYVKDPADKKKWIVDEEAAEVVKRIFNLCIAAKAQCRLQRS